MKLYYSPGACSLAPHILVNEAAIPIQMERVDTAAHQLADGGDYYDVNSKGQVPVLELDTGERLTEGPVIAQYIADRADRRDLMPEAGSLARYRVMEWQNYITSELHKSFTPLFHINLAEEVKQTLRGVLRKKYEWLDERLAAHAYLTGDTFTAADAYLFTVTNWAKHVGLDLAALKNLQAFQGRVASRQAVRDALKTEGLAA